MGNLPTDRFGNIIEVGDYIAYPVRTKSDLETMVGKVKKIRTRKDYLFNTEVVLDVISSHNTKKTTVSCLGRTIVVPKSYVQHSNCKGLMND